MAYDVFLVSAIEDRDTAKLVARRLRALKFRVWLDDKQTNETFDAKDARDATNSQSMVVLWSENAVRSDWVRAAASVGHSRPGTLIQTGLDKTIPYEPFKSGKRISLDGMTSRKTPEGFFRLVEELERRSGRRDLRAWMSYGAKDEDQRLDWLAAHPSDPLAVDTRKRRERDLGIKPAPAAAAIGAAALAAASLKGPPPAAPAGPMPSVNGPPPAQTADTMEVGWGTIAAVGIAIAGMLFLSWAFRSQPAPQLAAASSAAIANARMAPTACPAGTFHRDQVVEILEPGPIVDDTQPQ